MRTLKFFTRSRHQFGRKVSCIIAQAVVLQHNISTRKGTPIYLCQNPKYF